MLEPKISAVGGLTTRTRFWKPVCPGRIVPPLYHIHQSQIMATTADAAADTHDLEGNHISLEDASRDDLVKLLQQHNMRTAAAHIAKNDEYTVREPASATLSARSRCGRAPGGACRRRRPATHAT